MTTTTISVEGMTCDHCVRAVRTELLALAGVTDVVVDLRAGETSTVTISSESDLDSNDIRAAVDEAGYTVV